MAVMKQLVVSICLLGFAWAYDFSDGFFNQFLTKEYEEIASDRQTVLHARLRRDDENAKCHHKIKFCCGDDLLHQLHETYRAAKKECYKEITGKDFSYLPPFTCEELEERKKNMICVSECAGKKHGFVDTDGNLIEDEVSKVLKTATSALEWWKPLEDDAIAKCIKEAQDATKKQKEGCNPADLTFSFCIIREIQMACPEDQIKDKARCETVRESFKKHQHPVPS